MSTGDKIRMLRENRGITQEDLAKKVGYKSRSSIAKIETGDSDPSQRMLLKIATALDVSPAELLDESTEEPENPPKQGVVKIRSLANQYPNMSPEMQTYVDGYMDSLFLMLRDKFPKKGSDDNEHRL